MKSLQGHVCYMISMVVAGSYYTHVLYSCKCILQICKRMERSHEILSMLLQIQLQTVKIFSLYCNTYICERIYIKSQFNTKR